MTRRGRASRERVVERAAGLFAERGIAATSVDEVLAAAGAGKGQFYHYFRSRDELAAAAVGYRCAQVVAGLTQALGGVSSLAGLEEALAGFIAGPVMGYTIDFFGKSLGSGGANDPAGWTALFIGIGVVYLLSAVSWLFIDCTRTVKE